MQHFLCRNLYAATPSEPEFVGKCMEAVMSSLGRVLKSQAETKPKQAGAKLCKVQFKIERKKETKVK